MAHQAKSDVIEDGGQDPERCREECQDSQPVRRLLEKVVRHRAEFPRRGFESCRSTCRGLPDQVRVVHAIAAIMWPAPTAGKCHPEGGGAQPKDLNRMIPAEAARPKRDSTHFVLAGDPSAALRRPLDDITPMPASAESVGPASAGRRAWR